MTYDNKIPWGPLGGMDGFVAHIFDVDMAQNTVDFIVKFFPNTNSLVHRHLALTHTLVLAGDHVIYETNGSVRESRPAGRYSVTGVTGDVHAEGGGPEGCTLLYSVRGDTDALFEIIDENAKPISVLRVSDFAELKAAAVAAA